MDIYDINRKHIDSALYVTAILSIVNSFFSSNMNDPSIYIMPSLNVALLALKVLHTKYIYIKTFDDHLTKKLYYEFLNNYKKLIETLEIKNLLEMQTFYENSYYNGYLSKNKKFEFDYNKGDFEILHQMGANVLIGRGVCRHVANLFSDLLNVSGITSVPLAVKTDVIDQSLMIAKSLEENYNFEKFLNNKVFESVTYNQNNINSDWADHMIVGAVVDDKRVVLDPTSNDIYYKLKDNIYLSNNYYGVLIDEKLSKKISKKKLNDFSKILECTNELLYDKELSIKEGCFKFVSNLDMLEKFYKENKEIYEDVSDRMQRLRKNK